MTHERHARWQVAVEEQKRQRSLQVTGPLVTLGRDRGNAVPIDSVLVSGWHLELSLAPEGPTATDLGSRNGTTVLRAGRRKPIKLKPRKPMPLELGDVLLLGGGDKPVRVQVQMELVEPEPTLLDTIRASRPVTEVSTAAVESGAWPMLLELNHGLLSAETEDEVLAVGLAKVLQIIPQATHATVAFFIPGQTWSYDSIQRVVQLEQQGERPTDVPSTQLSRTIFDRIPLDRVMSEGVGLVWSDEAGLAPSSRTLHALEVHSAACAPLWIGDLILGVVQADVRGRIPAKELTARDLDRILVLAGLLALALRNAQTIRSMRNQRDHLAVENTRLQLELSQGKGKPNMVGRSPAMVRLRDMIARVAPSDLPVLIYGETGTGKELVARTVHSQSTRPDQPFVACNVATLPPELVEAELFGAAKGAYTGADSAREGLFEAANHGTLFLDELGELLPAVQAKLLRTLQEGEYRRHGETKTRTVDVRLVAATNRDLETAVREGAFRQDLLYRVNTVTLEVPPLRDRGGDIPLLTEHLLLRACTRLGRPVPEISDEVRRLLTEHPWPGNVRQLENELARAVALTLPGEPIVADSLSPQPRGVCNENELLGLAGQELLLKDAVSAFEREYVRAVLSAHEGNRTHTAKALGLTRAGLQKLIRRHGLQD